MQRVMLKSKIHRATVTDCDLHYVGLDHDRPRPARGGRHPRARAGARRRRRQRRPLRDLHDRRPSAARARSCVNGAAARLVHHGDTIIVISYASYDEAELERYEPRVVHVEAGTNRIITIDDEVATLLT